MDDSTSSTTSMYQRWPITTWSMPSIALSKRAMKAICKQSHSYPRIIGSQASSLMFGNSFLDAWSAKHTRCLSTQPFPPSLFLPSKDLIPSRTSLWISSWTLQSIALILSWSWLTMALLREIAKLFFENILKRFELHKKIMSYCGFQFASAFVRELASLLQYNIALSLPYYPQTNGEMEYYNQELEMYLYIFCEGQLQKWLELLSMFKFAHNATIHSVTRKSPFFLIMGYESWSYPPLGRTFLPALKQQLNQIENTQKKAKATHKLAQK